MMRASGIPAMPDVVIDPEELNVHSPNTVGHAMPGTRV